MLIGAADDQGRIDTEAQGVKWNVCQNVDEIPIKDVPGLLAEIAEQGMLLLYGLANCYGQMLKWWEYQKPNYAKPSKLPPPDGWTDRWYYKEGGVVHSHNWDKAGGFPGSGEVGNLEETGNESGGGVLTTTTTTTIPIPNHTSLGATEPFSQIFTKEIGVVIATGTQAEEMDAFMGEIPEDWFRAACKAAVDKNARNWAYVRKICKRCHDEGIAPGEGKHGKSFRDSEPHLTPEQVAQYFPDP
jgi:hypothetical protein